MSKYEILVKVIEFLKIFEGYRSKAYDDGIGVWTIGYGTTVWFDGNPVKKGYIVNKVQAQQLFVRDLEKFETYAVDAVNVFMTQHEFSALVSFTYNVGVNNLLKSTLLKLLNQKLYNDAADQFDRWVYARDRKTNKWKKLRGLVIRRKKEKQIFMTSDDIDIKEFLSFVNKIKIKSYMYYYSKRNFVMNEINIKV